MVLFIVFYKLMLTIKSMGHHTNESCWAVLFCGVFSILLNKEGRTFG